MNTKRNGLQGVLLAAVGMFLIAAPQLGFCAVAGEADELDEVTVEGSSFARMRMDMVALEKRFYALYNQLNQNDDFDVNCNSEAPLGSHIQRRVCRVVYYEKAQAEYAQALMLGYGAPPPEVVELERRNDYRASVLKVLNSDQRLLRLVREREALEKRYYQALKKRFKRKSDPS